MSKPVKVFGIGLSKTGTSSLKLALETLGYRVSGSNRALLGRVRMGDVEAALSWTERFDGFEDWPYPLLYRECFEKYGDQARFVLTVRASPPKWFRSIQAHSRQSRLFRGQKSTYGYYRPFGRERDYLAIYETHNAAVREFFYAQGAEAQLLEVCWESGSGWEPLCSFLGEPVPQAEFPHRNKTDPQRHAFRRYLNAMVEPLYRTYVRLAG